MLGIDPDQLCARQGPTCCTNPPALLWFFFCLFLDLWDIPGGAQVSFRVGLGKSYGMPEVEPKSVPCKTSALFTHCTIFLAPNCLIKCRSQSPGHQAPGRQGELIVAPEDLSLFLSFFLSPPLSPSLSPHPLSFSPSPCLRGWNPFLPCARWAVQPSAHVSTLSLTFSGPGTQRLHWPAGPPSSKPFLPNEFVRCSGPSQVEETLAGISGTSRPEMGPLVWALHPGKQVARRPCWMSWPHPSGHWGGSGWGPRSGFKLSFVLTAPRGNL